MTCKRDRSPGKIEGQYLHKKIYSSDNKKVTHLFHPFLVTKNIDKVAEKITVDDGEDFEHVRIKAFQYAHVLFHPTLLCNIITLNALNNCKTSDMIRPRG